MKHALRLLGVALAAALTALALGQAADQPPGQDPPWVAHNKAARAAREAKNYAEYRTHLLALNDLFFGHPTVVYSLAVAEAQLGNRDAALKWLNTFAAMGLYQKVAADPNLTALRDTAEFQQVTRRLDDNLHPISRSTRVFALPSTSFVAEDIAWDPRDKRFLISSVRKRSIIAVDASGHATDFVTPAHDGIWSVLALAADPPRGVLWASTAAMPIGEGYQKSDEGRTALLKYDLHSGALLKRYDLAAGPGGHVLGDMTISSRGDVYVSDSLGGPVYTLQDERLKPVCDKKEFRSPQTPALFPGEKKLFVADYGRGIAIVDLATRAVSWLHATPDISLIGIDGLYRAGNDLIAVQNGTNPMRLLRIKLDSTLTRVLSWETMEANSPGLGSPNHGVIVGDTFYFIADSGWDQFDDDGRPIPNAPATAPAVWKMSLKR
jgi:hypothetical protein